MMKRPYSQETREKALALYAVNNNTIAVSEELNIPRSTIQFWITKYKGDGYDEYRKKVKIGFIEKSSEIIEKGLDLIDKKITRCSKSEKAIDDVMKIIAKSGEITQEQITTIEKGLLNMQNIRLNELTTAVGTLYDKRALAKGESTSNVNLICDDTVGKLAEIAGYEKKQ